MGVEGDSASLLPPGGVAPLLAPRPFAGVSSALLLPLRRVPVSRPPLLVPLLLLLLLLLPGVLPLKPLPPVGVKLPALGALPAE